MMLIDDILKHLSLSVKKDDLTKKSILLTAMSAYSNNPLNLFLKGESGEGKTYNATQALRYFPDKDVWLLGGLSPTALVHSYGVLEDEDNREIIQLEDEEGKTYYAWKDTLERIVKKDFNEIKKNCHYVIDLRFKILLFLESPHFETYNYLRPLLSHDAYEITYKFTDKSSKGSLSAKTVLLRGWPATLFCTTDAKYMQDLITRSLTISPDQSAEKYNEAKKVIASKYLRWKFEDKELEVLKEKVRKLTLELKQNNPISVFIPFADRLAENFPVKAGGDMRAFDHYLTLIQNSALLNMDSRPVFKKVTGKLQSQWVSAVLATFADYQLFHEIFIEFAEASRAGIPKKALELFKKCMVGKGAMSPEDIAMAGKKIGIGRDARQISHYEIQHLKEAGFIREVSDPDDKRRKNWEAVGVSELYEISKDGQKMESYQSLCSFSLSDAQTFLRDIGNEIGITNIEKSVESKELLLLIGLHSNHISITDFVTDLSFPESIPDKQKELESRKIIGMDTSLPNSNEKEPELKKSITWRCPGCNAGPFTESAKVVKEHQKFCQEYKEYTTHGGKK